MKYVNSLNVHQALVLPQESSLEEVVRLRQECIQTFGQGDNIKGDEAFAGETTP